MKQELKKRIAQINAGTAPEGYKKTKVGIVPEEWEEIPFGKLVDEYKNKTKTENEDILLSCAINGIFLNSELFSHQRGASNKGYLKIEYGTLILSAQNLHLGNANVNLRFESGMISPAYKTYRIKNCDLRYFSFWIKREETKRFFYNATTTGASQCRRNIEWDSLYEQKIALPPLPEQQKIAEILTAQDEVIALLQKRIELKQQQKKYLMQKLLSGEVRVGNGVWKMVRLGQVLSRVINPVKVEKSTQYRQIGLRSHGNGIFYKEEVSGAKLGNKAVFWVEPDCFILNIVFAWEQAIGKTTQQEMGMIASHRFPMYKPNGIDIDYLIYFLLTKKGATLLELASPGGAGRNRTLGQEHFLNSQVTFPPLPEQEKIAEILSAQDKEIELLQQQLALEQQKKKALMQLLLTGKVRVKT